MLPQQPQIAKGQTQMSVLARSEHYLRVPQDELRFLSSPPCSPVPKSWLLTPESPPMPCLQDDFDLDAVEGIVHLGGGRTIDLSQCRETPHGSFSIVSKGAIVARNAAGTLAIEADEQVCRPAPNLPPILVESYE